MTILVIVNPQKYMEATLDGFMLFGTKVFPSLFPFFLLTKILTALGVGSLCSKIFSRPIESLYKTSPLSGYILSISMISGYPVGARLVTDYASNGYLSNDEVKTIISFTSTSGPLFILGTVGVKMLGNYKAGMIIMASHFIATILNGLLYRGKSSNNLSILPIEEMPESFINDAIYSTITSMLQVGGSIIFLNLIIVVLQDLKVLHFLSHTLNWIGMESIVSEGISIGLVEITKGVSIISKAKEIKDIIVPIATIISFGGVSVMLQSMVFLKQVGISSRYYLVTKASQAILTYFISSILVALLY